MRAKRKTVFFCSVSSDIGFALAQRYSADGFVIAGTYRSRQYLAELKALPKGRFAYCDLRSQRSMARAVKTLSAPPLHWDTYISCPSVPYPMSGFFKSDFDRWTESVHLNAIEQLRMLHAMYPYRRRGRKANVVFFAGPASNGAVKNFSALAVSKIMLIKMCELLDAETPDLNVFIVGPGWTRTKAHDLILADPDISREKYRETTRFLKNKQGTSMDDIYASIRWLSRKGRRIAGGRNFSVVHDRWGHESLASALDRDQNMYKLRRFGNEWRDKEGAL